MFTSCSRLHYNKPHTDMLLFLPTSGDRPSYDPTGPWWSDATARAGYAMTTTTTTYRHTRLTKSRDLCVRLLYVTECYRTKAKFHYFHLAQNLLETKSPTPF